MAGETGEASRGQIVFGGASGHHSQDMPSLRYINHRSLRAKISTNWIFVPTVKISGNKNDCLF